MTQRCHNRAFLLKFARDRSAYRTKARERLRQLEVSVLGASCARRGRRSEEESNLNASLAEKVARGEVKREPCWTASLAVGRLGSVEKVEPLTLSWRETEVVLTADKVWVLQEAVTAYGQETDLKNGAKAI